MAFPSEVMFAAARLKIFQILSALLILRLTTIWCSKMDSYLSSTQAFISTLFYGNNSSQILQNVEEVH